MIMNLFVGNDNGNSEQDLIINGEMICQPNVHAKVRRLPNLEEVNPKYVAENIHDNLIVSIRSKAVNGGAPTAYYIGSYSCKTGKILKNIEVGADNSKINSEIPIVNTLGHLAGFAVRKAYEEDPGIEKIDVKVDMTTALPVNQYSQVNAHNFTKNFLENEHEVIVYLGSKEVQVNLVFEYVKVLPEGVTTVFYLKSLASNQEEFKAVFGDMVKEYKLKDSDISFENKKILHIAIGEGTTEFPLTEGISFKPEFIKGTNNGVGHAINEILQEFISDKKLTKLSRQEFSNILKDETHKYHEDAVEFIQDPLEEQAGVILDIAKQEIGRANNDIDCIVVYGGGSILMKDYLKEPLKAFANKTDIMVLYVPKPYAVEIEARGMFEFTNSKLFKGLKKKYLEVKKGATK